MALITNLSPPVGEPIAPDTVISFDVIDPVIGDLKIFVWAVFKETGQVELAFDGDFFQPLYTLSQINPTVGGRTFSIRRVAGWPFQPELRVDTCACPPDLTGSGSGITTFANVGTGVGVGRDVSPASTINLKSLVSSDGSVIITPSADEIDIKSVAGTGEANTASNVGAGVEVFKQKALLDLEFRKLKSLSRGILGSPIIITEGTDDIEFALGDLSGENFNTVPYSWPGADGSAGQHLTTNGGGLLTWTTPAAVSATGIQFRYLAFDFNDFTNVVNIGAALPTNAIVIRARAVLLTALNGTNQTIKLGEAGDDSVMLASENTPTSAGVYLVTPHVTKSGVQLTANFDADVFPTSGTGEIVVEFLVP